MVNNQSPVAHLSNITMYESHDAVRTGVSAVVLGPDICFAPGAFQPHTASGRQLIEQQFDMVHPPVMGPSMVPTPYPNIALHASALPVNSNILMIPGPAAMMFGLGIRRG